MQSNTIVKYINTALIKLFKMTNKSISISIQPAIHVTTGTSNIT